MNSRPLAFPGITRRHLLRQIFAYSAAATLGSRLPAFSAPAADGEGLHFFMLGDFGNATR